MLTRPKIEHLINQGRISIWYSFLVENKKPKYVGELKVTITQKKSPALQEFRQNFFGDRLKLTLGPIVMSHNDEYYKLRRQYGTQAGCFDLRENGDEIILESGETLSVSTNERIRLDDTIAAITLPRLSNADSGLVFVPSYIDPNWDGILQGVIVNLTKYRQKLRLCEGIAICRFYEVSGEVPIEDRNRFPSKSHHYANNWPRILEQEADPFPRKKKPVSDPGPSLLSRKVANIWQRIPYSKHLTQFVGISAVATAILYAHGKLNEIDQIKAQLTEKSADSRIFNDELAKLKTVVIPNLEREVQTGVSHAPTSGVTSAKLPIGTTNFVIDIRIPRAMTDTTSFIAIITRGGDLATIISAKLENAPDGGPSSKAIIHLSFQQSQVDREIELTWIAFR